MTAKPEQPEQRDQALARMLAEALKPTVPADAAGGAACPDAEILAAYADQGLAQGPGKGPLGNDERIELEHHFAACERCQQALAALGAALEAPVGESVAELPAPALPAAPRPAARPSSSPQRWLWWLTPAFGAAAAALLWMVLRPVSPGGPAGTQTAADYSKLAEQNADSLTAQANLPAPAAQAVAPRARATESAGPGAQADKLQAEVRNEQSSPETTSLGGGIGIDTFRRDESTQSVPTATLGGTLSVQEPAAGVAAPPAAPAPRQGPAAEARGNVNDAVQPQPQRQAQARALALDAVQRMGFSSPDGSVSWRLGAAGRIERSTDRGQTWQQQPSGVTADLLGGSAASNEVAWVVGRAGVILRTTDGQQWQRIPPPGGVTGDWAAVVAHDAMNATVVAGDLRRFSTADGGRTWTQQQ